MTIYNNNQNITPSSTETKKVGFANYNNTISQQSITSTVNTPVLNNGLGIDTNTSFLPDGVTSLMDTSTGSLNFTELDVGDMLMVRNDFNFTPTTGGAVCKILLQFNFGTPNQFFIEKTIANLQAPNENYKILDSINFYIGNEEVRNNPCKILFYSNSSGVLINNGSYIKVDKR